MVHPTKLNHLPYQLAKKGNVCTPKIRKIMKFFITFLVFFCTSNSIGQNFHTEFVYEDIFNGSIKIQNSYPKGGQGYTSPKGKNYVFVVFWSCITNETDTEIELKVNLSPESFVIPSSPNVEFNLYLPEENMLIENESLPNYGLDVKSYLDKKIGDSSNLITSISPKTSHLLYMVAVSNQGVNGTIRAGFELEGQKLFYHINGHKVYCGEVVEKI